MGKEAQMEKGKYSSSSLPMKSVAETGTVFQKMRKSENIYFNMYSDTNRQWTGMVSLLFRWKHSVFSLIWNDVLTFLVIYFLMSILYRNVLYHYSLYKQTFEMICIYANWFGSSIPITFLVGFWVTQVVSRWWDQFMTLPYPENLALKLVAFIPGRVSKFNLYIILKFYGLKYHITCFRKILIFVFQYQYLHIFEGQNVAQKQNNFILPHPATIEIYRWDLP